MPNDPVPILALAVAIAWISLVTVEFYERIYRERIEKNRDMLKRLGEDKLRELFKYMEAAATEGRALESKIEERHGDVRSLLRAQEDLFGKRRITFILLVLLSMSSLAASYAPNIQELIALDYFLLAIVFFSGFWFLNKMFWFDKQILIINEAKKDRSEKEV